MSARLAESHSSADTQNGVDDCTALERAIRARDHVLAMVSHDLRDPLGTIITAAELLLWALVPDDSKHSVQRVQLQAIRRAAGRMRHLAADLLDASALDAGKLRIEPTAECPFAIMHDAVHALESPASAKGVTLVLDAQRDLPSILVDRERIAQVFANLLGNAIKFTPSGGVVTLTAARTNDDVRFSIADTGSGIPPADLPFVFERFWRSRNTGALGSGLGLSIGKGIVEAHGGTIKVQSVPGEGRPSASPFP